MTATVRHVGIVVQDLELCVNFWKEIFEFEIVVDQIEQSPYIDELLGINNPSLRTVKLSDQNGMIVELLKFSKIQSQENWIGTVTSTGLTHVALEVENIVDIQKNLENLGYKSISKILESKKNNVKVVFIHGPEKLLLELVEIN